MFKELHKIAIFIAVVIVLMILLNHAKQVTAIETAGGNAFSNVLNTINKATRIGA